jgi:hydrogenase expression/formation protein HypC
MCLGLPGRVVTVLEGGGLGQVEIAGVVRQVDLSLLPVPPSPGDYLLVHSGIALEPLSPERAREAIAWFTPASAPEPETRQVLGDEVAEQQ